VLTIGSESEPSEVWFFRDRGTAFRFVSYRDLDVIAQHGRLLGNTLCSAVDVGMSEGSVNLDHSCSHALIGLLSAQGRIRVSLNGMVGDAGVDSGSSLLVYPSPGTRQRLVESEQAYRQALRSREVLRLVQGATICNSTSLMATVVGLDNREMLPPFFPAYRGEDGIFGSTLNRCFDGSYTGYLPWALLHSPDDGRTYTSRPMSSVMLCDLIGACISSLPQGNPRATAAARLRSLGQHLVELGTLPRAEFLETVRILLWQRASQIVARCEALLQRYGSSPEYWAADVKREIETAQRTVLHPTYPLAIDLRSQFSLGEVQQVTQNLIRQFGELLYWWPTITEKARDLSGRGVELGRVIQP